MTETLREALDETQRMLEYLWTATGNRAPDLPVCDLFNDDDPIIQDVPTVIGRARMALARSESPSPEGLTEALRPWLRHKHWCNVKADDPPDTERCKCGLRAALVR